MTARSVDGRGRTELVLREGCVVDLERGVAQVDHQEQVLTAREVELLRYLGEREGRAVSADELHREVFGHAPSVRSRAAFHAVQRLRLKVEPDPADPQHLQTVHGTGWRLILGGGVAPPALFGRKRELAELREASRRRRLVTVTGLGGVGKTALVRAARLLGPWVQLGRGRAEDPALAVAAVLGLEVGGDDPVDRVGRALAALGPRAVVLDDAEGALPGLAATLARWLDRAPEARFVVTSRAPMGLYGEQVLALDPLPVPPPGASARAVAASPAVQLWRARTRGRGDGAALVRALEGHPLAIELAAAHPDPDALAVEGSTDPVEAAIGWSWSSLSAASRVALAQLGVFGAPFTVDAAEAVLDLPGGGWAVDAIQELLDRRLLHRLGSRLWALDRVRGFASAHLADRTAVEARHGALYAALPPEGDGAPPEDLIDAELAAWRALDRADRAVAVGAARAVARRLGSTGPFGRAIELLEAVVDQTADVRCESRLAYLLGLVGRVSEAAARMERLQARTLDPVERARGASVAAWLGSGDVNTLGEAVSTLRAAGDPLYEARALVALADAECKAGRPEDGIRRLVRAVELQRRAGDRHGEAGTLANLAAAEARLGRLDAAAERAEAALALYRDLGSRTGEGRVLGELSRLEYLRGRHDAAAARGEQALELHRESGWVAMEVRVLVNLSAVHRDAGAYQAAELGLERAIELSASTGDPRHQLPVLLGQLAGLRHEQGRFAEALAGFAEVVARNRALDRRSSVGIALGNLAQTSIEAGQPDQADAMLVEAVALHRETADRFYESVDLANLGALRSDGALLEEALALARRVGSARLEGSALGQLGAVLGKEGRFDEARARLDQAAAVLAQVGDRRTEAAVALQSAELELDRGRLDVAEAALDAAETQSAGHRPLLAGLAALRARVHLARGDRAGALATIDGARGLLPEGSRVGRELADLRRRASNGNGVTRDPRATR